MDCAAAAKFCIKCRRLRHLCDFDKDSHFRDGLRSVCKECARDKNVRGKHA